MPRKNRVMIRRLILIISLFVVFIAFWLSQYILEEKRVFPFSNVWFLGGVDIPDTKCVKFHSNYFTIDMQKGLTKSDISFDTLCKGNFYIFIEVPNITSFYLDKNYDFISKINKTSKGLTLEINGSLVDRYTSKAIYLTTSNNFEHYSIYNIRNSPTPDNSQIDFIFDRRRYLCNEGCIFIMETESKIIENLPLIYLKDFGKAKVIRWQGNRLLYRFQPESTYINLLIKTLDGIFLGLMATLIYLIFFKPTFKKLKLD